jgi:hypothetical protein
MQKYALINNNVVTGVIEVEPEQLTQFISTNDMVIDITNQLPLPAIGYVLNGNRLEIPQGLSSREDFEIELNSKKAKFGTELARVGVDRIGARNKILNKSGPQVINLLTQLIGIKSLLETGALGTARYSCSVLKTNYSEYADIFDYIISEINAFEATSGL